MNTVDNASCIYNYWWPGCVCWRCPGSPWQSSWSPGGDCGWWSRTRLGWWRCRTYPASGRTCRRSSRTLMASGHQILRKENRLATWGVKNVPEFRRDGEDAEREPARSEIEIKSVSALPRPEWPNLRQKVRLMANRILFVFSWALREFLVGNLWFYKYNSRVVTVTIFSGVRQSQVLHLPSGKDRYGSRELWWQLEAAGTGLQPPSRWTWDITFENIIFISFSTKIPYSVLNHESFSICPILSLNFFEKQIIVKFTSSKLLKAFDIRETVLSSYFYLDTNQYFWKILIDLPVLMF